MKQKIRGLPQAELGCGAAAEVVLAAEQQLALVFPPSYREFLREFGWIRFNHFEIYGLGADAPDYLNVVRNTLAEREEMSPGLPRHFVALMNDGAGNHYCLDTGTAKDGEAVVVFWDHESSQDQEPEFVAVSFAEWLIGLITRANGDS